MHPTLTTTISNYNYGHLVGRAIENVMTQSRKPDELLIHDDGSSDGSKEVINSYVQKYPCMRVQGTPENRGLHAVLPCLIHESRSEWLHLLAADDYPVSGFYEKAMGMAERYPQAGLIVGNMLMVVEDSGDYSIATANKYLPTGYISPEMFLNDYLAKAPPNHSLCGGTFWRKQCIIDNGMFHEDLMSWTDTFAAWNIALTHGVVYIDQVASCIRVDRESYSGQVGRNKQQLFKLMCNATVRMRSDRYSHLYPKEFISDWERRCLDMIRQTT